MAEIKNYTQNFGFGRSRCSLNFAEAKLACAEIQRVRGSKGACGLREVAHG